MARNFLGARGVAEDISMHRRTGSQPCAFSIAISAPSLAMAWVVGLPNLPHGMGRSQLSNLPPALGIEPAIPGGGTVPLPRPLGCLRSLHGPPVPKHNTKQCMPPGGRVVTAQPAGPALSGPALSLGSKIIFGSWGLSTPGLNQTGDLQRVRLTSQPLEHGCSASRMSWGRALSHAHNHCHALALWRARYFCTTNPI